MTCDTQTIADTAARLIVEMERHLDNPREITGVRFLAQSLGVTGIQLDHAVQLAKLDGRKPKTQPDFFGALV